MDSLKWQQDANGLHVIVPCNGIEAGFTIDNSFVNHLLAGTPRIYFVFVQQGNDGQEISYILDLTNLKPVISKTNGLKFTVGKPLKRGVANQGMPCGRYCVARGESYHERFLTSDGWQSQRSYYNLLTQNAMAASNQVEDSKPESTLETKIQTTVKQLFEQPKSDVSEPSKPSGKLKVCQYCGEIYPSAMSVCPYCSNKPKNQQEDDDILDISI